jgi:Kelch motif
MRKHFVRISSLLLMLGSLPAPAQLLSSPSTPDNSSTPTWTELFPGTNPSARYNHAMAYDAAAGKVVMFAGLGPSGYLSGTFLWNGHNWTQEQPKTHPSPRYWHSMAYDGGAKNVVLFGGFDPNFNHLNDTWV